MSYKDFRVRDTRWWEKVLLWFIPSFVIFEDGYAFFYKQLFGVTYFIKQEELPSRKGQSHD